MDASDRDVPFLLLAHRVQMIGELHARIERSFMNDVFVDPVTVTAWMTATQTYCRVVLEFLLKRGKDTLQVAHYAPGWRAESHLHKRLLSHLKTIKHHVVHHIPGTDVAGGYPGRLPVDILDGVDSLVAKMGETDEFFEQRETLRRSSARARDCVESPDRHAHLEDLVQWW